MRNYPFRLFGVGSTPRIARTGLRSYEGLPSCRSAQPRFARARCYGAGTRGRGRLRAIARGLLAHPCGRKGSTSEALRSPYGTQSEALIANRCGQGVAPPVLTNLNTDASIDECRCNGVAPQPRL